MKIVQSVLIFRTLLLHSWNFLPWIAFDLLPPSHIASVGQYLIFIFHELHNYQQQYKTTCLSQVPHFHFTIWCCSKITHYNEISTSRFIFLVCDIVIIFHCSIYLWIWQLKWDVQCHGILIGKHCSGLC